MIKLFVLICMLICCAYGDTIQAEVVLLCLLVKQPANTIILMLYIIRGISFEEHLPEDGQSSWPKHVVGYAVYNAIHLHLCICNFDRIYHHESSVRDHE